MIEPWVTPWSRLVYSKLHHEPFQPEAVEWTVPQRGPLSGANSALPWIIFDRDRTRFEREFPEWQIHTIKPFMPFRYLLSGGVSMCSLMPGWSFALWRNLENLLRPWMKSLAMFALIVLVKEGEIEGDSGSYSPNIPLITCCDHGYGRPSWRPRVVGPCDVPFRYASEPTPCGCPVARPSSWSRDSKSWNIRARVTPPNGASLGADFHLARIN